MSEVTRVLIVEDIPTDALLMERELRRAQISVTIKRVDSEESFLEGLQSHRPDLILSDHSLPQFGATDVLRISRREKPTVPVIVVTGSLDEETAAEYIKEGATDYIVKHHLERLGPAVVRALALRSAGEEKRRAEEQLRISESRLRAILNAALDAVVSTNSEGIITVWNNQAEAIFGWPEAEVLGRSVAETIFPERDRERGLRRFLLAGAGPVVDRRIEATAVRSNGIEFPIELTVNPVRLGDAWAFSAFLRDVSDRQRAEEVLRTTQARLQQMVAASVAVIYAVRVVDHAFEPSWVSENIVRLTGFDIAEALSPTWWIEHVHPEDRLRVQSDLGEVLTKGQFTAEYRFRHKDGSYRWILDDARLQHDASGRPVEVIGAWIDVTERRNLESQLRQAQKMEVVGQLAGGIAHDFNNMLTAITGNADLIQAQLPPGDALREDVEEIKSAASRAGTLTRQLLAFSRQQMLLPRVLELDAVISGMDKMLRRIIGEDVELVSILHPHTGCVEADPSQVEQVILNLAVNARDAMPEGGKLTIETSRADFDDDYASAHPPVTPGSYIMLAVSDTGTGMSAETKARIFEPFFTTKDQGKGTGLGLATVYGIVKQSGGFIWVYSEPEHGTTFKVYLPRVEKPADQASVAGPTEAKGGTETILLVEDETPVRKVARQILERLGYIVLEAKRAEEALAIYSRYAEPIHLVLTDVVMPGMSGTELVRRISARRSNIKVLFTSGYPGEAIARLGVFSGDVAFLSKPFTAQAMAHKVRAVLDA